MRHNKIHAQTIELLLSSITMTMGDDGAKASFFYGRPGTPHWDRRMGADIYYHFVELKLASLFVRSNGPSYLRALAISDITSKLQDFISSNFWYLGDETFAKFRDEPLNQWISEATKDNLADALSRDVLFAPKIELNLFPLIPVVVRNVFEGDQFSLSPASSGNCFGIKDEHIVKHLDATRFPPEKSFKGPLRRPQSWLSVFSADKKEALKVRSSILGAIALTSLPKHRHLFSGREVFGGQCTLGDDGLSYSFEPNHTPPCMYDIVISKSDAQWLQILSKKINDPAKDVRRQMIGLEYFFKAWDNAPSDRFPILCMVLEALYGDPQNATQAIVDGVQQTLGAQISNARLRVILQLRGSVVHGRAPDVYDSSKYPKYYKKYKADPISDLELIAAACLRKTVFDDKLLVHVDPNADIIKEAQAAGRLPRRLNNQSILSE
ncbi:hypothetical protein [Phaeobacter sp. 11ANDIMAR09]|uniref:hypothetical protein n=1 Tax=Phaeobacter sp. 11ANDIMAR09 TaxID=1225647 RepID=UPI000AB84CE1|nr:hypothetical protein [Phaeobacter sp. 11ANDIMAR09]